MLIGAKWTNLPIDPDGTRRTLRLTHSTADRRQPESESNGILVHA